MNLTGFWYPFEQFVGGLRSSETRLHAEPVTRIRSALCKALDLQTCSHQAQRADAAHNPALFIRVFMFS